MMVSDQNQMFAAPFFCSARGGADFIYRLKKEGPGVVASTLCSEGRYSLRRWIGEGGGLPARAFERLTGHCWHVGLFSPWYGTE